METETDLYWSLVRGALRAPEHLSLLAGREIGRLVWEASGLLHFAPATSTSPGRIWVSNRRKAELSREMSEHIEHGLAGAAKRYCGDDWQENLEEFFAHS
jgi:hypothetical protein